MPIRITGMNSGLDTESIISELVKAQKTKVDSVKKKQTTIQWKQDAWKELNAKIYKLFQNTIGNMRLATDYSKKITDVSNSAIASVISGDNAMDATQKLKVERLAKTGYMTGDKVEGDVTSESSLSDLGIKAGSTITVTTGGKSTDISITEDMTIGSFVNTLREAGVEASFDEKNKRFHIASKKSGEINNFSITAANEDGTDALKKLGILSYDEKTIKEYEKYNNMSEADIEEAVDQEVSSRLKGYISQREELLKTKQKQNDALAESEKAFSEEYGADIKDVNKDDLKKEIDSLKTQIEDAGEDATEEDKDKLAKLQGKLSAVEKYESQQKELEETEKSIGKVESYLNLDDPANITASDTLRTEVDQAWRAKIKTAHDIVEESKKPDMGNLKGSNAKKIDGEDAHIVLNGVDYYGESNTFEVNGLTITALQESSDEITLTTRRDTDGVYNIVKNFLKEYNSLINEMDKLYNAEAAKDYEPLTDEEKKELSDSDVEKWETKIKDSILRRDSNLSTISSAMKNIMLQGATVNGKQMYLANFGIETLGYFSAAENERNAYHINGDEDDSAVSSKDNELKAAIASDPDTVIAFFSQLSQNLYAELDRQSRSVEGIRSFGSFYDDKRMQEDYKDYAEKIKKQEARLTAMEDKWYKKFSAMETAMAKMQSNQSAVSSLLGGM